MLPEMRGALRSLLQDHGKIDRLAIDIAFEPPTQEWVGGLTRPTLNLFLFDVQENTDLRQTNFQRQPARDDGLSERRRAPRRIDLSYMVSAFTSRSEDEDALLWRALVTLMKHAHLPVEALPDALRPQAPSFATRVKRGGDGPHMQDLWSMLGTRPHPALCYVVTVPLDLDVAITERLTLAPTIRYARLDEDRAPDVRERRRVSGVVHGRAGEPIAGARVTVDGGTGQGSITGADGLFELHGVPPRAVTLRIKRPGNPDILVTVPSEADTQDVVVDG